MLLRFLLFAGLFALAACGDGKQAPIPADTPGFVKGKAVHPSIKIGKPYRVMGEKYYPRYEPDYDEVGIASWYGPNFHGKMTANGETFNQWAMTAAHTTLPLPSMVRVTDVESGKSIVVRVNDRGPFADGRIIDLSRAAAEALGTRARGLAKVRVQYLKPETEAYIAKLQLKKPESWRETDLAQAKIEKALHAPVKEKQVSATEFAPLPASLPPPDKAEAETVPEHFAYEDDEMPATTIDERGVEMEEIGYAVDAFSVLEKLPGTSAQAHMPAWGGPVRSASGNMSKAYLLAGTFADERNAQRLAGKLRDLHQTRIRRVTSSDRALWQVLLGPVVNRSVALALREQLAGYHIYDALIITE